MCKKEKFFEKKGESTPVVFTLSTGHFREISTHERRQPGRKWWRLSTEREAVGANRIRNRNRSRSLTSPPFGSKLYFYYASLLSFDMDRDT
jgi:hypothetical protein